MSCLHDSDGVAPLLVPVLLFVLAGPLLGSDGVQGLRNRLWNCLHLKHKLHEMTRGSPPIVGAGTSALAPSVLQSLLDQGLLKAESAYSNL